jgi:hypothetical protein
MQRASFILHKNGNFSLFPGQVRVTIEPDGSVYRVQERYLSDGPIHLRWIGWRQVWHRIANRGHGITQRSKCWLVLRQCGVLDPIKFVNTTKHVVIRKVA